MFQLRKGSLPNAVQAGLLLSLTVMLNACGEQPAPVDTGPAPVVATASSEHGESEFPVVTITASREPTPARQASKNEG